MSTTTRVSDALTHCAQSAISIVKLMLQSRSATITKAERAGDKIIILGNGPSLNDTISQHLDTLKHTPTMAVNFAANTEVFSEIRPRYYVLMDPLFFTETDKPNFQALWQHLASVTWRMTIIVPVRERRRVPASVSANTNIDIATVNAIAVEGWKWLTSTAYGRGWGMPRPRNVLILAIMAAVQMGYKEIYLTGADHSWMQTISVNERNEVISVQPHFYKEDDREVKRINTAYMHRPLHDVIQSFYVAFKSYHDIKAYTEPRGIRIYNSTPGSFIDAFPRRQLGE